MGITIFLPVRPDGSVLEARVPYQSRRIARGDRRRISIESLNAQPFWPKSFGIRRKYGRGMYRAQSRRHPTCARLDCAFGYHTIAGAKLGIVWPKCSFQSGCPDLYRTYSKKIPWLKFLARYSYMFPVVGTSEAQRARGGAT